VAIVNNKKTGKKVRIVWKGFFLRLFFLLLLAVFSLGGYFGYRFYDLERKVFQEVKINQESISVAGESTFIEAAKNLITEEKVTLRGEERKRINVLLLGMGGEGHKGENLTDTIMLVSINPETYQAAFLSIPRDLYVNIPQTKIYTKINAVYAYEIQNEDKSAAYSLAKLKTTVKNVTGQEVDYYIALDFEGFKKVIDELGGIDIEVEKDILDNRYPGPNYSFETFYLEKGFHHLDGETALKYSRVRHVEGGDFGRARRQQQVLAAVKKKAFSLDNFTDLSRLNNLIDILGEHLKTDIHFNEISTFLKLTENINIYQSTNKVLDAWSEDSLLTSSHILLGGAMAYVLIPRARDYSQVHYLAENIFDLAAIERKNEEIKKEKAKIFVFSDDYPYLYNITKIFERWGYQAGIKQDKELLEKCRTDSVIFNNGKEAKIFTLDDLSGKLNAKIVEESYSVYKDADILVCLSEEDSEYLAGQIYNQEDEQDSLKEKSVVDEKGNILFNNEK
jgi:LCP family protein required for cell wall assembly